MTEQTAMSPVLESTSVATRYEGAFSNASAFEAAQRMARALTSSSLVPKAYQGNENIGNAIIALEMAQRIGASPLMVCQNLYVVHGTPSWSAKFLIATFNQCGRFSAVRYNWKGDAGKKNRACQAWAVERETGEKVEGPWIDWALVSAEGWDAKNGSKWKMMPEKMFMYRAAAWLIDLVAPEISMGLPTQDQAEDYIDVDVLTGEVLNAAPDPAAKPATRGAAVRDKVRSKRKEKVLNPDDEAGTKADAAAKAADDESGTVTYAEVAALVNDGKLDEAEAMESLLPGDQAAEISALIDEARKGG